MLGGLEACQQEEPESHAGTCDKGGDHHCLVLHEISLSLFFGDASYRARALSGYRRKPKVYHLAHVFTMGPLFTSGKGRRSE